MTWVHSGFGIIKLWTVESLVNDIWALWKKRIVIN
jgi:hypothetical protein